MKKPTRQPPSVWMPAAPLLLLLAVAAPRSHAVSAARADVAGMEFIRTRAPGLEAAASNPGTHLKLLLTHGEPDWRAFDFTACKITTFTDDEGGNLALRDASGVGEDGAGIQSAGSVISADGTSALVRIWGGGLPSNGADEIHVTGDIAMFCGPDQEETVDRADVRLAGGETFNVQPFRVVTSRGDQTLQLELRYLRNAALVRGVSVTSTAGRLPPARDPEQTAMGEEWVWRGEFVLPPARPAKPKSSKGAAAPQDTATISVGYLPIKRVEQVPFDITVGIGFKTPPANPLLRWLRRFI
jgi:hypothetical protein